MTINGIVDENMHLRPATPDDKRKLNKTQMVGNVVKVEIDNERQRSTDQLRMYWGLINHISQHTKEKNVYMLIMEIAQRVAATGVVQPNFLHTEIKAEYGVESIALCKNTPEVRQYFNFSIPRLEDIKEAFCG